LTDFHRTVTSSDVITLDQIQQTKAQMTAHVQASIYSSSARATRISKRDDDAHRTDHHGSKSGTTTTNTNDVAELRNALFFSIVHYGYHHGSNSSNNDIDRHA
jgi:hypothetical protein